MPAAIVCSGAKGSRSELHGSRRRRWSADLDRPALRADDHHWWQGNSRVSEADEIVKDGLRPPRRYCHGRIAGRGRQAPRRLPPPVADACPLTREKGEKPASWPRQFAGAGQFSREEIPPGAISMKFGATARSLSLAAACFAALAAATPAPPQDGDSEARVGRLEAEVRALQRKVFPGGDGRYFEPQISAQPSEPAILATPSTTAVTDILARLDALEAQLQRQTALNEQNSKVTLPAQRTDQGDRGSRHVCGYGSFDGRFRLWSLADRDDRRGDATFCQQPGAFRRRQGPYLGTSRRSPGDRQAADRRSRRRRVFLRLPSVERGLLS